MLSFVRKFVFEISEVTNGFSENIVKFSFGTSHSFIVLLDSAERLFLDVSALGSLYT